MPRTPNPGSHDALLESARAEFARHGLERARVEDIARRAGVSKGAFYLHFRTKEDAFEEILQRFFGALEEHASRRHEAEARFEREEASRPGEGGALDRQLAFECQVDAELLEILWRNRPILAALDRAGGQRWVHLLSDFRRRMRDLVAGRILARQEAGRLRPDVDPEVVGQLVVGTYEAFGRRMLELKQRPDLAAWVRSLLLVVYEGVLDRTPRAAPAADGRRRAPLQPE